MKDRKEMTFRNMSVFFLLALGLAGCASAQLPLYLQDRGTQVKRFYASYDQALTAVEKTLADLGWQIDKQVSPSVYEQSRFNDLDEQQVLILTAVRAVPGWTGKRYGRLNVYLRSKGGISEVELRVLSMNTWVRLRRYGNHHDLERLLRGIEQELNSQAGGG